MRSPVSPIIAKVYMGDFKTRALACALNPPNFLVPKHGRQLLYDKPILRLHPILNSMKAEIQFTIKPTSLTVRCPSLTPKDLF